MLIIETETPESRQHFEKVRAFAESVGATKQLLDALRRFDNTFDLDLESKLTLHPDFAPYSFIFTLHERRKGETDWKQVFWGGLIYTGPGQPSDGSAPAFTVSLGDLNPDPNRPLHRWTYHT